MSGDVNATPGKKDNDEIIVHNRQNQRNTPVKSSKSIKSLSDTTLYTPALRRTPDKEGMLVDRTLIYKISEFVESVRLSGKFEDVDRNTTRDEGPQPGTSGSQGSDKQEVDARTMADKRILEAEKLKTSLTPLKGMAEIDQNQQYYLNKNVNFAGVNNENGVLLDDDEFFHITCHVDPVLRAEIGCGEFVELEKLLTKDRFRYWADEGKLESYSKDGHTFLAPANRESKITNIRCWEPAFHVYAAIYSKANPSRTAEIWQYIYVINTVASYYTWENVSFYDYMFHQMMSVNPQRSWSKIFNQMWNLAMHDPVQKQQNYQGGRSSIGQGNQNFHSHDQNNNRKRKGDACWRYNRNDTCNAATCHFEHKCSYCCSYNHSMVDCPKLKGKMNNTKPGGVHSNNQNNTQAKNSQSQNREHDKLLVELVTNSHKLWEQLICSNC